MQGDERLSPGVATLIADAGNEIFVSAVSAWEIALKVRLGKMPFDGAFLDDFEARARDIGLDMLPVSAAHAVRGARLDGEHRDPFDRLLVGQALVEVLTVATRDAQIARRGAKAVR